MAAESGMGKTSAVLELAARVAAAGGMALYGRCDRELWTPYQPFPEVLERYAAGCTPEELCRRAGWAAPELVRLFPELSALGVAPTPAPAAADASGERHRLFSAVTSLLAAAAADQPVLLIIDDLHWAGPGALLLVRHLSRALERSPLMIVAAYRPQEARANNPLLDTLADIGGEPGVTHLELTPLDVAAVGELARRAGRDEWVASAAELWQETGGNPFLVTELLSHAPQWRPHGDPPGGVDVASPSTAAMRVPPRIRDVVAGRRSRLSSDAKRILEVAAVTGPQFEVSVLEQVTGLAIDALLDALDEAAAARLVVEDDGEAERYRFVEPLVRDAIYEQTGTTRRCRLHATIGQALEGLGAAASPDGVMALAHHFAKAGRVAPAGKAVDYTVHAGDLALARLAYERAASLYERALELGLDEAAQASRRCHVLVALAEARRKAGRVGAARETYLEAIRLARSLNDPEDLAVCALGLSGGGRGISAWVADEVRVSMLEEALSALGPDRPEWRAKVEAELAKALYFSDQHDRADALAQEALALAREAGDHRVLAAAVSATRVLRWGPGNTELRLSYAEDLVGLGEAAADPEVVVRARLGRLADLLEVGERPTVDVDLETVTSLADRLGQPYYRWRARAWGAALALVDGDLGAAERGAREALALWGREPHPDASAWGTVHDVVVAVLQGRAGQMAEPLRELAEDYPMVPAYCCLLALVHAAAGDRADAWLELERFAADGFTDPPFDTQWLFGVAVLAETCARLADTARAQPLYELLSPFSGRLVVLDAFGGGVFWGPVSHHLGLLAATLGRPEEAQRHFADAMEIGLRTGARLWVSRASKARAGDLTAVRA